MGGINASKLNPAAASGSDEITIATVRVWFEKAAPRWPKPDDDVLAPIARACNQERQRQAMLKVARTKRGEMLESLRKAIQRTYTGAEKILHELPKLIKATENRMQDTTTVIEDLLTQSSADHHELRALATVWAQEDAEAVEALLQLQQALKRVQPFIKPRRKQGGQRTDWNDFAMRIATDLLLVLQRCGLKRTTVPLIRLLQPIIDAVFGGMPSKNAVAGVLRRWTTEAGSTRSGSTRSEAELKAVLGRPRLKFSPEDEARIVEAQKAAPRGTVRLRRAGFSRSQRDQAIDAWQKRLRRALED